MHPAYFETRFRCAGNPVVWPQSFSIVTAYATTGEHWPDEKNRAADQQLSTELSAAQLWMHRITGYSPSTGHAEPGWAVNMPFEQACDVGQRYQQDAVYCVNDDRLFVSFCDDRRGLVAVDRFTARLDRLSEEREGVV